MRKRKRRNATSPFNFGLKPRHIQAHAPCQEAISPLLHSSNHTKDTSEKSNLDATTQQSTCHPENPSSSTARAGLLSSPPPTKPQPSNLLPRNPPQTIPLSNRFRKPIFLQQVFQQQTQYGDAAKRQQSTPMVQGKRI